MPGPINFPLPGARRLTPDFNHHRKVAALVRYEVHGTEYKAKGPGPRVNAYCQACQLTKVFFYAINRRGSVGQPGPDLVRPTFWFGVSATPPPWPHVSSPCGQGPLLKCPCHSRMERTRPWPSSRCLWPSCRTSKPKSKPPSAKRSGRAVTSSNPSCPSSMGTAAADGVGEQRDGDVGGWLPPSTATPI